MEPAADTLYSTTVPYCDVGLEPYAYDMDEAARLLDEAGWTMGSDGIRAKDGQKLALDLLYNSDSVTEKRKKDRRTPQPSIRAASSSAVGTLLKYGRSVTTINGTEPEEIASAGPR